VTALEIYTKKGSNTSDNQDVMITAMNEGVHLYLVMDGCSTLANSGGFARAMGDLIHSKFTMLAPEQLVPASVRASLVDIFESSREQIKLNYMSSSMSLAMLVVIQQRVALLMHVGDCAIGRENSKGQVDWLTIPHTVVNKPIPELIGNPYRHGVCRSFKAKRESPIEWVVRPFNGSDCFVLASDGWWDSENRGFSGECTPADDISVIRIRRLKPA